MPTSELARHADEFLRVACAHPQYLDGGLIRVTEEVAHLFVVLDVEMTLASRARGVSDTGVHKHERVEVMLAPSYPWHCPIFYLRADFPTALPHLSPGQGNIPPRPCLIDGSAGEYFSHFGLLELGVIYLLDQMAIWLARAAAGQLMNPQQGWEPLPRYEATSDIVLNTDDVRARTDRRGGWTVVKSEYYRTGTSDADLGTGSNVYLQASNTQTALYEDRNKLAYTRRELPSGNAMGKTITAIIWPGRHPGGQVIVSEAFFPETVNSLADLRARAAEIGSHEHLDTFLTRFEQSVSKQNADFPIPMGIVLCIRRPYKMMNRRSDIELIPYALEVRPTPGRTHLYTLDEKQLRVVPLRPLEQTGPGLMRDLSGSPVLKAASIIGCGSVGSKIALHLARAGATITAVADSGMLLPHNMARHGLIGDSTPTPKANALEAELVKLGQSPGTYFKNVVSGLKQHADRRQLAPSGTELLVNTTASLLVREALSLPTARDLAPRVAEVALFGRGNGAFVFLEGQGRNPTLSDLIATLYATTTPAERTLLTDPAYGLTQVQIGEGCGSLTMPMTDARLSAMTAAATEELERLSLADHRDGEIVVGLCDAASRATTWRRLSVQAFRTVPVDGGFWTLRLSPEADAKIRADIGRYPGVETGGYLIGTCSARLRTITVVDVLPAPADSRRTPTLFVLGITGAQAAILQRHEESGKTLMDVGTWHSHLAETGASPIDRATARKLAAERAPPAVLLIATPASYCCIVHNPAGCAMDILKQFDAYNLKARVFPALIAGLPTLALLFVIVPWDHFGVSHVIAGAMGFVLLFAFADLARHRGKSVEAKLSSNATPERWHRGNPDVPEGSKDRFRTFVAGQLKQAAPTAEEERANPHRANDFYLTANAWLRSRTSQETRTFSILFGENITYGYRRNLLGLKPIGLLVNLIVMMFCGSVLWFHPPYFAALADIDEKLVIIIVAAILHSAYLLFAVGKKAVWDASRVYGRQLILSCDTLMNKSPAAAKKKT